MMARRTVLILALCVLGCLGQSVDDTTTTPDDFSTETTSSSSTEAPSSSTTTPPPSSTTTPPPPTTTSSEAPDTTTTSAPPTPTPTPTPKPDNYFRVTENSVTCIMFSGDIRFTVDYPVVGGKRNTTTVTLPRPDDNKDDLKVNGSCFSSATSQYIDISWGPTNTRSSYNLQFVVNGTKWMLNATYASLYISEKDFTNSTDNGKNLHISGWYPGLSLVPVDTNSSLVCRADVDSKNFSASVDGSSANFTVTGTAIGVQMQAFNYMANTTNLQEGGRCEQDVTSDLVPIAVGCALAGLVLLVLIAYLVGRRRRSAAYQSV